MQQKCSSIEIFRNLESLRKSLVDGLPPLFYFDLKEFLPRKSALKTEEDLFLLRIYSGMFLTPSTTRESSSFLLCTLRLLTGVAYNFCIDASAAS